MVACSHLWNEVMWWQGIYGVFCFYLLSGYLISFIINEVYIAPQGVLRYGINRLLRIYPLYWTVFFLIISINTILPDFLPFKPNNLIVMSLPGQINDWIGNLFLLYNLDAKLSVSQAWSLRVELVFYLLMILLVRRFWIVALWFLLSAVYVAYNEYSSQAFIERYTSVSGASIAFSIGSLLYYLVGLMPDIVLIFIIGSAVVF